MTCNLKLIQDKTKYRFTMDTVLLAAFTHVKRGDVLADFCSGSGVVPVLICGKTEKINRFFCVEIQPDLAELASRNLTLNGLDKRGEVICADVADCVKQLRSQRVNLITANPPYSKVGCGIQNADYGISVARSEILITMKRLVESAASVLAKGGRFVIVHTASRSAELIHEMYAQAITPKVIRYVQAKSGAQPHLVLVEGIKGGGDGVTVLEPLIVYDADGLPTAELKEIYSRTSK